MPAATSAVLNAAINRLGERTTASSIPLTLPINVPPKMKPKASASPSKPGAVTNTGTRRPPQTSPTMPRQIVRASPTRKRLALDITRAWVGSDWGVIISFGHAVAHGHQLPPSVGTATLNVAEPLRTIGRRPVNPPLPPPRWLTCTVYVFPGTRSPGGVVMRGVSSVAPVRSLKAP